MLPDFPKLKQDIKKNIVAHIQRVSENDPLLNMVGHEKHYEGDRTRFKGEDGYGKEAPYTKVESPADILTQDIILGGPETFLKHGLAVAEDIKNQMLQNMFKHIDEGVKRVGNTIDQKGQSLSAEHILEALSKMLIAFNDDGTPNKPTFVSHPDNQEHARKAFEQIEKDPELRARHDAIMKKKKEEWDASEGNRKLVD